MQTHNILPDNFSSGPMTRLVVRCDICQIFFRWLCEKDHFHNSDKEQRERPAARKVMWQREPLSPEKVANCYFSKAKRISTNNTFVATLIIAVVGMALHWGLVWWLLSLANRNARRQQLRERLYREEFSQ